MCRRTGTREPQAVAEAGSRRCSSPPRPHRGATRDEDEADGESLGDVVHGDRDRDQQTERRSVRERSPDGDSFGGGMHCHDADHQQSPPRVLASQRSHRVSVVVLEVALRHEHEADSERAAHGSAPRAANDALQREAHACREHHAGRDRVRRPQHEPASGSGRREAAARQSRSPLPSRGRLGRP